MLILAGPVSGSLCHCASRSMQPLISNGVEGALSLVHMPGPALHLDPYLQHRGFTLPAGLTWGGAFDTSACVSCVVGCAFPSSACVVCCGLYILLQSWGQSGGQPTSVMVHASRQTDQLLTANISHTLHAIDCSVAHVHDRDLWSDTFQHIQCEGNA